MSWINRLKKKNEPQPAAAVVPDLLDPPPVVAAFEPGELFVFKGGSFTVLDPAQLEPDATVTIGDTTVRVVSGYSGESRTPPPSIAAPDAAPLNDEELDQVQGDHS